MIRLKFLLIIPFLTAAGCGYIWYSQNNLRSTTLLNGLIAYYKFEEASGTRIDATGRGNDMPDEGTGVTQYVPGKIGNAAGFESGTAFLRKYTPVTDFDLGTGVSFSMAGWIKVINLFNQFVVGKYSVGGTIEWKLQVLPPNWRFQAVLTDASSITLFNTSYGTPPTGVWLFIFVAYDSTEKKAYISTNDGPKDSISATSDITTFSGPIGFGVRSFDGTVILTAGELDEWGFWRRRLTDAEVTELYNGGAGRQYPFQ